MEIVNDARKLHPELYILKEPIICLIIHEERRSLDLPEYFIAFRLFACSDWYVRI
jgi:hypothetical protein